MEDKNIFNWHENKIYLLVLLLAVIIIGVYEPVLGFIGTLILGYLVYFTINQATSKNEEIKAYIEDLSNEFESATKHAIFNMPFPLVLIDENGSISWYNTPFLKMVGREDILNKYIEEIIEDVKLKDLLFKKDESQVQNISYGDRNYLVYPNFIENKKLNRKNAELTILYWVDNTDYVQLKNCYNYERIVTGLIYVDNYDEIKGDTSELNKPLLMAEIDKRITTYFKGYNGIIRKYEQDKYLVILEHGEFKKIQERKIDLLDEIRELNMGNKIPVTLSMGISFTDDHLVKSHEKAKAAIDIALGRGGDQAVVNKNDSLEFYGGKSKAMEKRTKVRSRVISYALRQLIDQSDNVFVMGHKNPDMDSIGAGIGVLRAIKNRNKPGYLILNEENPSIKNLMDRMRREEEGILKNIILSSRAKELLTPDSLLIVVDNHKPSFTEDPQMLDYIKKVVVIDHHRRGAEFIEDPVLIYLEPYASSTAELVTEVLSYMGDDPNLTKFEAESLLAGITVDTKNFSFQTGVRTFEAASILKRAGADTIAVKQLFRDNVDVFKYRAQVIQSAEIAYEKIAIGSLEIDGEDSILIAAQAANELLDINGVEASFVLTKTKDSIHISGRSLGNISVQLILESLGGGGHLTSAGAQLQGVDMKEANNILKENIEKYLQEGEE